MIDFLEKRQRLQALLFYAVLISVFYFPVVFAGKSLQPPLLQPHGVVSGWPYGYEGRTPVNTFNIDMATPAYYEWPINKLTGDIYKSGELPLWNPYQAGGTPLAAQYSTRVFFPYQILEDISPVWTWDFFLLGRLLIAGFFTYLFLKRLGLEHPPSLFGGALYMFSGAFTWFINLEQFSNSAMMLPVLLHSLERLHQTRGGRDIVYASIAFALVILAGQPEVALYTLFLGCLWFALRVIVRRGKKELWKGARLFLSVTVLGLMLSAPLILPFLELVKNAHHIHPQGGAMGTGTLNRKVAIGILAPTTHEYPQEPLFYPEGFPLAREKTPQGEDSYFRIFPTNGVWDSLGGYTGTVALFLSFAGVFTALLKRGKFPLAPELYFFFGFASFVLLKNAGIAPFVWLGYLPFFDQVWSQRWAGPSWVFAIASAGAMGFQILKDGAQKGLSPEETKGFSTGPVRGFLAKPFAPFAFAFMLLIIILIYVYPYRVIIYYMRYAGQYEYFAGLGPSFVIGSALAVVFMFTAFFIALSHMKGKGRLASLFPLALLELWWAMPRGYGFDWLLLKLIPFVAGIIGVYAFFREKRKAGAAFAALFLISAIAVELTSPRGLPERYDPFTKAPYVDFIKEKGAGQRVMAGYGILFPNFSSAMGIHDIRYVNSLAIAAFQGYRSRRLHNYKLLDGESSSLWFTGRPELYIDLGDGNQLIRQPIELDFLSNIKAYSLLGVRYIILPSSNLFELDPKLDGAEGLKSVYDREVKIYENPFALGRAYVAYNAAQAASAEEAEAAALEFSGEKAVIEKEPPKWFKPSDNLSPGLAAITKYSHNTVTVETNAESDGVLVLNDMFYPGWKAYVDGEAALIYRVNGLVRGVFVKKGAHTAVFRYSPASFKAGALLSFLAVLTCLAIGSGKIRI